MLALRFSWQETQISSRLDTVIPSPWLLSPSSVWLKSVPTTDPREDFTDRAQRGSCPCSSKPMAEPETADS